MQRLAFAPGADLEAAAPNYLLRHDLSLLDPSRDIAFVGSRNGHPLTIRPLRHEDEPLLTDLKRTLVEEGERLRSSASPSAYERAAHDRLVRMLCIDGQREIALVVENVSPAGKRAIVGMGWLSRDRARDEQAELSLLVTSAWQGCGVGSQLLAQLLKVAGRQRITRVHSDMLRGDLRMRSLCARSGFTVTDGESGLARAVWNVACPFCW